MCGRFVQDIAPELLATLYNLPAVPELPPRYNIAPSQQVAVVRQDAAARRDLTPLRWGLIPPWAKDPAIGHTMINARSETAHEKPSFRQALKSRRCLIPANGFYEWRKQGKERLPHFIHRRDGGLLSLAGLWERWTSPEGAPLETCTILTTAANALIKPFHERMPVLLEKTTFDLWLDREVVDVARLVELFRPSPDELLDVYAVSQAVNSPRHDAPDCIRPV
jgi:putative SOS response-associated peptidase YedK